jgi:hypothetical protein
VRGPEQIYWAGFSEHFVEYIACSVLFLWDRSWKEDRVIIGDRTGYILDLWHMHITFYVSDGEPIVIARFIVQSGISFFSLSLPLFCFISRFR